MSINNDHQPKFPQTPNNAQTDPSDQQPAHYPDHVEAFDYRQTSLEDAIRTGALDPQKLDLDKLKQVSPFREVAPTVPTDTPETVETKKKKHYVAKIVAGFAVGAAVVYGGTSAMHDDDAGNKAENALLPNANPGVSAPQVPGETQSYDQANESFNQSSFETRLSEIAPFLKENRDKSLKALSGKLPVPTANGNTEEKRFAQEVLNYNSADLYTLYGQKDIAKRLKGINGIYLPGTGGYDNAEERLQPNGIYDLDINNVISSSKVYASGNFGDLYTANNQPTMIVRVENNGIIFEKVMSMYRWGEGESVNWIVVASIQRKDKGYVFDEDLTNWQPSQA